MTFDLFFLSQIQEILPNLTPPDQTRIDLTTTNLT